VIPVTKIFPILTRFHLAWQIEEWGWRIGDHSYGQPRVLEPQIAQLQIGRFCSIGPDVTIALGNHRTDLVTTYPFTTLAHIWPSAAEGDADHEARGDVVIHHDVWLGANSIVLSGAEIGSGAVVAAHAVVRGKVPPYAVVAGNPARVVRMRFDAATVDRLLAVAWWDWPDAVIGEHLPLMMKTDIGAFLDQAEAITN
jgi:virginiamycin A acetyltransferase